MKNIISVLLPLFLLSCGKEKAETGEIRSEVNSIPPYDTLAVDSFSTGATSVDIAQKIRMSSLNYQDSIKNVQAKMEEEKLLKKAIDEKATKDKKAVEEKKKEEEKKSKVPNNAENTTVPNP